MAGKERIDILLVDSGLVQSRERAKAIIMAGQVLVNGQKIDKPGTKIDRESSLHLLGNDLPYVSRGGLKLEEAIKKFNLDLDGKIILDIGASTGGFTDCALKHGAAKVFAVDVGYGQLAWELRQDDRVVNMERVNARYLSPEDIGEQVDLAAFDVAFISLTKVMPAVFPLVKPQGKIVALIKPQFEAGRQYIGKKGVVRDPIVHRQVIARIMEFSAAKQWIAADLAVSPIKGPEGNLEFLACFQKNGQPLAKEKIAEVVNEAWSLQE